MANYQVVEGHRLSIDGREYEFPAKVDIDDSDQADSLLGKGIIAKPGQGDRPGAQDTSAGEATDGDGGATHQSDGDAHRTRRRG